MTNYALYAITTESTVGSDGLRQFGHLVTIGAKVAREVVLEIADMPAITYIQLNTLVLYLTGIDPLATTLTHHTDAGHIHQNILCLLEVPLQRTVECIAEHTEVKTDIGLSGGLPLQVVITQLVALKS